MTMTITGLKFGGGESDPNPFDKAEEVAAKLFETFGFGPGNASVVAETTRRDAVTFKVEFETAPGVTQTQVLQWLHDLGFTRFEIASPLR